MNDNYKMPQPKEYKGKARIQFLSEFCILLTPEEAERVASMEQEEWLHYKTTRLQEELDKW